MNYQQLKDFCNSLTNEQLQQEVFVSQEEAAIKVSCGHITEEDTYWDHTDLIGTLEDIKKECPDNWEEEMTAYTLVPKGTVTLCEDF